MTSSEPRLQSAREIAGAMVLALLVAAYLGLVTDRASGGVGLSLLVPRLLARAGEIAFVAGPPALLAVVITEWLKLRHVAVFMLAGCVAGVLGALIANGGAVPMEPGTGRIAWTVPVLTMGVGGGLVYWGWRGNRAGAGWQGEEPLDVPVEHCRRCARLAMAAAAAITALVALTELSRVGLIESVTADAARTVDDALSSAGHSWARVEIEDAVARLRGVAPDDTAARAALATARSAFAPMMGIPGVIATVEDATTRAPSGRVQ